LDKINKINIVEIQKISNNIFSKIQDDALNWCEDKMNYFIENQNSDFTALPIHQDILKNQSSKRRQKALLFNEE
jgi:hypothetical protein